MSITNGAGHLGQLIDYLRDTSCAYPGDAEHDHDACQEVPVARVAEALLGLVRRPDVMSMSRLAEALDDDEHQHLCANRIS